MKSVLSVLLAASLCFAGVYNIKILNDNQPDYSDFQSFGSSIFEKQNWTTTHEKAISLWQWITNSRIATDVTMSEFGLEEYDCITYLNSVPNMYCSYIE